MAGMPKIVVIGRMANPSGTLPWWPNMRDVVIIEARVNIQLIANIEYVSARARTDRVIVIVNPTG